MFGLPPLPRKLGAALTDAGHARVDVRLSALRDLVRLTRGADERAEALGALERLLTKDPSAEIRAEAAMGLADAEAVESNKALIEATSDRETRVRQMAVLALGEVAEPGDADSITRVRALLDAPEPAVRFQALIAFARLAPDAAERPLAVAAADDDDEVRAMAYRLMDARYEHEAPPAHLERRAVGALEDSTTAVRAVAALFLGYRGEPRAHQVIVGIADGTIPPGTDADLFNAFDLAASLGLSAARSGLRRRAFGPFGTRSGSVAWHALVALAALGDERAKGAILRDLSAWTRNARTLAVVAAGRARLVEARPRIEAFRDNAALADPDAVNDALAELGTASD
jgi:HEAT repeat protein